MLLFSVIFNCLALIFLGSIFHNNTALMIVEFCLFIIVWICSSLFLMYFVEEYYYYKIFRNTDVCNALQTLIYTIITPIIYYQLRVKFGVSIEIILGVISLLFVIIVLFPLYFYRFFNSFEEISNFEEIDNEKRLKRLNTLDFYYTKEYIKHREEKSKDDFLI